SGRTLSAGHEKGASPSAGTGACSADLPRADCGARRPQPFPPARLRTARAHLELLGRRLLPVPARRGEGRARTDACAARVALLQSDARAADERRALPPEGTDRVVAQAGARLVPRDVVHLPAAGGRRGNLERPLAVARAVAAH